MLTRYTSYRENVVTLFAALMSVPCDDRATLEMSPEQRKERTLEELVDQLQDLSAQQPVVAVFEDVHWIDPTSLDLLDRLVGRVSELRVLLIITYRSEFESPWPRHSHLTVIPLSRLDDDHSLAMVEDIARNSPIPRPLVEQIVHKADGIPLFVEELTKTVLEYGALSENAETDSILGGLPSLAIPSTSLVRLMSRSARTTLKPAAMFSIRTSSAASMVMTYSPCAADNPSLSAPP